MTFPRMESSAQLRQRLKNFGFSDSAIDAAWPVWWSDAADTSPSAQAELRFSIARKLGIASRSLLTEDEPQFVWRGVARFKHLSGEGSTEQQVLTSFGVSLATMLTAATRPRLSIVGHSALELRSTILNRQPMVRLTDLMGLSWSAGIPIIHLRVFPSARKRMAAMAVRTGERYAILLAKDAQYPAPIAFYIAHELAHIILGHLDGTGAIVDMDVPLTENISDGEESAADRFALGLLTGSESPTVLALGARTNSINLANVALAAGPEMGIEPGTLALCFGYSTGAWAIVNAAMKRIYTVANPVWRAVNQVAATQLNMDDVSDDARTYLQAVLELPL